MEAIRGKLAVLAAALPSGASVGVTTAVPLMEGLTRERLLDDLDALLSSGDAANIAFYAAHAEIIGASGDLLARQINQFDFEPAAATLRALR